MRLKAKDGRTFEFNLSAGLDTADWAFDRPDIRARIRHKRPAVGTSYDINDAQHKYKAHTYVAAFGLPATAVIESGEIVLEPQTKWPNLLLTAARLSLINTSAGKTYPLGPEWVRVESTTPQTGPAQPGDDRWKLLAQSRFVDIYENTRALPRAWLATQARAMDDSAMLQTIRTGIWPDGARWDPLRTALIEAEPSTPLATEATDGRVEITRYEPNRVNLQTHCTVNSILVLSENDYPGWRAYIDGHSAEVMRVNYAQRGVMVPAGDHQVSFVYRPWSVLGGFLISLLTACGLLAVSWKRRQKRVEST